MEKRYLVCLVCCEEFKGGCGGGDLERKEENLKSLKQFCEVILDVDKNELDGKQESTWSKFLQNTADNLSICKNCLDLVVTEARLSAKFVEESVEKLQMLLLRELRRLQGRLDMFCGEFTKMEETLVNGDLKLVENVLDKSYSKPIRNEGRKKKLSKMNQQHLERKREVFGFREKISKVFSDFHQFKSKLVDKITCNPVRRTIKTTDPNPSKKMGDAQIHVEIPQKHKSKHKSNHKQSSDENDKGLSKPPEFPRSFDETRYDNSDNPGDTDPDDETMHLDNFEDNDNCSEDNQVETKLSNSRASLRNRNAKKKYNENSSDSDEDDKPGNSGKDDDGGDEYEPYEPVDNIISSRAQYTRLLKELEPHLAQMSTFKRNLVRSVIKCQCLAENTQMTKGPENTNLFQRHMTYLSYNVETQLITLSDIPIKILCQAEEENGENGLLCMKCDFKVDESPKMQTVMYDHVLSKHLNAYQCPHCKDKSLEKYEYYRVHLYRCRQSPNFLKVSCEICGNVLSDKRGLRIHKWRAHMSENERKEALERGLVKEYSVKSTKGVEKTFQCEQCGKSFSSKTGLKRHEEIHIDRDSRKKFICPKCGKSFLEGGYKYHVKYDVTCGPEEDGSNAKKQTCEKCGKILKNKVTLRRHMREVHEKDDLRPFVCQVCGKGFKKRMALKYHETTHTGEKMWKVWEGI